MTQHHGPTTTLTTSGVAALLRLAVLGIAPDGRISYWNRGAEELFGHRWDGVFGRHASGLLPAVSLPSPVPPRQGPVNGHCDGPDRLLAPDRPLGADGLYAPAAPDRSAAGRGTGGSPGTAAGEANPADTAAPTGPAVPTVSTLPALPAVPARRREAGSGRARRDRGYRDVHPAAEPPEIRAARVHRDALDRLDYLTRPSWAGAIPVVDRDGRVRDTLWWSYRLTEPGGTSLLLLAAHAKPLRTEGPRLAVGDQMVGYACADVSGSVELRVTAGLASVRDPALAERLSAGLGAVLPRSGGDRSDRIMRQLAGLGFPVLELEDAGPFAVLPHEIGSSRSSRRHRAQPAARADEPPAQLPAGGGGPGFACTPREAPGERRKSCAGDPLSLLRAAGARIGTTLELDTTAGELCEVAVNGFADIVSVHLVDRLISDPEPGKDGRTDRGALLRRIAVRHVDLPASVTQRFPEGELLEPVPDSPWHRPDEPLLVSRIAHSLARDVAGDLGLPEVAPLLHGHSLLVVPLVARGTVLGRLLCLRQPQNRPFDHEDITTASELAARGALSIDNARLHLMESRSATTLQRSMLPERPPKLPGVRIAHHYRPGDRQAQVGGDWFDAVQLPGGRVALVVGDVMGHGLHSAAVMGQFRTAVQTMAALDLPPAQLLRHLDNLAHRLGRDHLATCVYVVYDPIHRTCTLANAGHVPPVLARADGPSELLQIPEGAPIGVGGVPFETVEIHVPDGSWLVLCTDGLVEVREEGGIETGLAALCENVIEPRQTPEDVCDAILSRLHTEDRSDDVALLVARFEGIPPQDVAEWRLSLDLAQVPHARSLTRKQLADWGLGALSDLAELLVSELVTNALRAATRSVELRLMRVGKLLVEVSDDDHNLPLLVRAEADDEGGRGLTLVSNLSARWGTSRKAVGKVVWFELPFPHEEPFAQN